MSAYLMEHPGEGLRLTLKTDSELARQQLTEVGLADGMLAVDAGAGNGIVTEVMRQIVGARGTVVALDASAERLSEATPATERVCCDVHTSGIRPNTVDFVWTRFLLEYLPDPLAGMQALSELLAPGGKLVVADIDQNGTAFWPESDLLTDGVRRITGALSGSWDPFVGRKSFGLMRQIGLVDVEVRVSPYHLFAGSATADDMANWATKLEVIQPAVQPAFDSPGHYRDFVESYLEMLESPDSFFYSVLVTTSGHRPPS